MEIPVEEIMMEEIMTEEMVDSVAREMMQFITEETKEFVTMGVMQIMVKNCKTLVEGNRREKVPNRGELGSPCGRRDRLNIQGGDLVREKYEDLGEDRE